MSSSHQSFWSERCSSEKLKCFYHNKLTAQPRNSGLLWKNETLCRVCGYMRHIHAVFIVSCWSKVKTVCAENWNTISCEDILTENCHATVCSVCQIDFLCFTLHTEKWCRVPDTPFLLVLIQISEETKLQYRIFGNNWTIILVDWPLSITSEYFGNFLHCVYRASAWILMFWFTRDVSGHVVGVFHLQMTARR